MQRDWSNRWELNKAAATAPPRRGNSEPADKPDFTSETLRKHNTLRKHESSTLTQVRTGKIGLKAFLFQCRVPGVASPNYTCGAYETAAHIILYCPHLTTQRRGLNEDIGGHLRTRRDLEVATATDGPAQSVARWMIWIGKVREFQLAENLLRVQLKEGE